MRLNNTQFLAAAMFAAMTGVVHAGSAGQKMDAVYTVPHELDCLVKGGHVQGATCDESGIYLSHGGGIVKIGWDGRKICETTAPWHLGDCFVHEGRLYAAHGYSKPRDGMRGWIAVWDATSLEMLDEKPVEANGIDGMVVLDGRIYYSVQTGLNPHGGALIGVADMSLKKIGEKRVDLGYWIHYGVQTMATDGKSLFFGNYGAPADKGNPKRLNCTRLAADLTVESSTRFACSEGFGVVPKAVSKRETTVFFAVHALGGNMQGWRKDPVGNPPRIRIDFYEYDNGQFRSISKSNPEMERSPRETVAIVVAHPDDLAGPSGTMLLLAEKYDVKVIDFTRGENGLGEEGYRDGSTARLRVQEEKNACRFLNTEPVFTSAVNYKGLGAWADESTTREMARLFEEWKPRAVFLHWPLDHNVDHVTSTAAALHALYLLKQTPHPQGRSPEIYFHEQESQSRSFHPTHYVDVGSVREKKEALISCYACQDASDILRRKTENDVCRGRRVGVQYAEAFAVYEGSVRGRGVLDDLLSCR